MRNVLYKIVYEFSFENIFSTLDLKLFNNNNASLFIERDAQKYVDMYVNLLQISDTILA
jgi:hypothetical protein